MFAEAQLGDSLLIQRGPYKFGLRDFDQHVKLIRSGHIVREERPSDFFVGGLVLFVLLPLLSFRSYEKWKQSFYMKVMFVIIPPIALIFFLLAISV